MLSPDDVDALAAARHGDPFAVLGMHEHHGALWVRTVQPGATGVEVIEVASGRTMASLAQVHAEGIFDGRIPRRRRRFAYRLRITRDRATGEIEDPYGFPPVLGELDVWLLAEGRHTRIYEKLGVHATTLAGVDGFTFAVWAPSASRVAIVGDFNCWDGRYHPMRLRRECGVWELFLPQIHAGAAYKYEIKDAAGALLPLKADPFAFATELRPATASIVSTPPGGADDRATAGAERLRFPSAARNRPVSIYEVHAGSWRRGENGRMLSWPELADRLLSYVREMGFTHVEFMPVMEHPFDGSWGYQTVGYFAATSRFGSPQEFMSLIDRLHQAGIGVLLDWTPAHFPNDAHGLAEFDGTHLYEHADPRQGRHPDWGTLVFNYGRNEVQNFLISNALFWIDKYHIDGLRVDAVASMLYLVYSRREGEWIPNEFGGRENLAAIAFIKRLNEVVHATHPGVLTIAEESTSWPMVTRPAYVGGLGFSLKWNMGWMNDTLSYFEQDPIHRKFHHGRITFSMLYAFTENFMLPFSHDEVVHGKSSLLNKMPGDMWQQFANLRLLYGYMFAHPGKKLLFMGGELGQRAEWDHETSIEWHLLEYAPHRGIQTLMKDLNSLYAREAALHEVDFDWHGFDWLDCNDADASVLSFLRRAKDQGNFLVVVANCTPVLREEYRVGVPEPGLYREVLNTDAEIYGGSNVGNLGGVQAEAIPWGNKPYSLNLRLPPLGSVYFKK
jgi:1,4-alpha-glucan branching enzyme